jgi:trigger factor
MTADGVVDGMATESGDIQVRVEKPGAWARRMTITVPAELLERERRSAAQKLAKQVRLPGFRKGKVPERIMQQRFGAAIEQEMLERVMGRAYREALQQQGLQPISQGAIDNVSYEAGKDLTFDVGFEIRPEIELNVIGGFEVHADAPPVAAEQVDQVLDRLRDEHATWHAMAEQPVVGDMVTVEITPLDAEAGVEPQPRRYELVLGEGQALPAIEDAILTLSPGTQDEFTVELPENADDPAQGTKSHRVRISMLEAKRAERPALDDEFARGLGPFEDLAALRARVTEDLQAEARRDVERGVRQQLVQQIAAANPFEVPDTMVDQYLERALPAREGAEEGAQIEQIRASARPMAEQAIRRILIVERIAEMEGLRASPAEIDARIDDIAGRLGRSADEVRAQLQKNGRISELEDEITEDKVFDYLRSLSMIR